MNWKLNDNRPKGGLSARFIWAVSVTLCYVALWGSLCSLAGLGTQGVPFLAPGGILLLAACCLPDGRIQRVAPLLLLLLGLLLVLPRFGNTLEGVKLWCNRVFQASAQRQRYEYSYFAAEGGTETVSRAMLPISLLSCAWYLFSAWRARWGLCLLPAALLLLGIAWLGVAPGVLWMGLLLMGALACLLLRPGKPLTSAELPMLLAGLVLALSVPILFVEANPKIDSLSESLRDRLALHTAAYGASVPRESETPAQETRPYTQEEAPPTMEESHQRWDPTLLIVMLSSALLLFLPALWKDRLAKKRADNRRGLQDPDPAIQGRAGFLYAMRWLMAAGLEPINQPYSAYAPAIQALDPALYDSFQKALPVWQLAAYGEAAPNREALEAVECFRLAAQSWAEQQLSRTQRWKLKYVIGL